MKRIVCYLFFAVLAISGFSQKRVLTYNCEFRKGVHHDESFKAYFLPGATDTSFLLVLKDMLKVDYIMMNNKFKVIGKISGDVDNSVMDRHNAEYVGGTNEGNRFSLIFRTSSKYEIETVNFDSKSVDRKELFRQGRGEKLIASFSDYNRFLTLFANDEQNEVMVYSLDNHGAIKKTSIPVTIPASASRKRDKLSQYLGGANAITHAEQPELSSAVTTCKVFSRPDRIDFVVNDNENPTHILTMSVPGFKLKEQFVSFNTTTGESKTESYVSSYQDEDKLFSVILDKKTIRVSVHDLLSAKLLNVYEIKDDESFNRLATDAMYTRRYGMFVSEKPVESFSKVLRAFSKGTEGVMVNKGKSGMIELTVGTYDVLQNAGHGGHVRDDSGFKTQTEFQNGRYQPVTKYVVKQVYCPGHGSTLAPHTRYFTSTTFKMVIDPKTLKVTNKKPSTSVNEQIKNYISDSELTAKASTQFSFGGKEYYGYYEKESRSYMIDEIKIVK